MTFELAELKLREVRRLDGERRRLFFEGLEGPQRQYSRGSGEFREEVRGLSEGLDERELRGVQALRRPSQGDLIGRREIRRGAGSRVGEGDRGGSGPRSESWRRSAALLRQRRHIDYEVTAGEGRQMEEFSKNF